MKRRTLLISIGGAAGTAGVIGTGAFTSVEADRDVSVTVANENNAYLGIEPSPSSSANSEFATQDSSNANEIALNFGDSGNGGSGVGLSSVYDFDDVFRITNQGTQTIYVWANFSNGALSDDDIWFYPDGESSRRLNDGTNSVVTVPVGETVKMGVHIDTNVLESDDGDQTLTATLTADVDVPTNSNPSDGVGEDAAVVSKTPVDGEYSSIQSAVDDVDGTTVYVEPGTYEETVEIDVEGLTLQSTQGRDQTSIGDPSGPSLSGPILRINAPDVVVDGFEIAGASGNRESGQGVDVNGDANNTDGAELRNLAVRNNDDRGLVVDRSSNILIEDALVEDNYDRGSMDGDPPEDGFSSSDDADGITLFFTDNSTIRNVTSRRNGDNGVYVKGDNNTVENVTVNANGDEGLDLSSDGSGVSGGATVTNLTTGGNNGEEVEIEGHSNDVTIQNSSITIDTSSESGPLQGPAGIAIPEMDGGSVSITGTAFNYGDDATQAYISDGAGAVDLAATIDDNDFEFVAVQADLNDDGTDDALRPSKFVTEGVNQFDFSGDGEFTTDVVAESIPDGETAYAHITSGGTQTTDYATTAVSLTSPTVPEPPTLGELTSGTTLTYGYYAGPNNEDSAPDEVYLLVEETDGTRHVLYRASNDDSPKAGEWETRNVHREISGNPDNNSGFNWFEITTTGRTNLGDGGSTSDLSNVYTNEAKVLAIAPGRGTTGGSGSVADVYYRDLRIGGVALGQFPPVSQTS